MQDPIVRFGSFFHELKRRKVYRVAAVYAAAALVAIQTADLLFRGLGFPSWAFSSLVVLAVLGFPVSLVLAWAFEVTPEGVQRTEDEEPAAPSGEAATGPARELSPAHAVARYGLVLAAIAAVAYASLSLGGVVGGGYGGIRSLAVLPLDNLSEDAEQAYFTEGMHDALIGKLAQIGHLRVISRTSTLRYEGARKSAPEIARELNVDAIVEGSVYRTGDSVRIQVQLVGVRPEERHLWARAYERALGDVLAIHGDVARAVAGEVAVELTPEEETHLASSRTVDPRAYESYLRGMYHLRKQTPEGFERGMAHLERAIDRDPTDPLPWAGLALGHALIGHGPAAPPDAFDRAEAAALRAVALDSLGTSGSARVALAEAQEALAEVRLYGDWDWPGARRAFLRALELNPSLAPAHAHYGWYLTLEGRYDEGIAEMEKARELDPLNPLWPAWHGWMLWRFDPEAALAAARASLDLDPGFPVGQYVLGSIHASEGRPEEAVVALRRAAESNPAWRFGLGYAHALAGRRDEALEVAAELESGDRTWDTWGLAQIHTALGDRDAALDWLEAAYERRHGYLPWMRVSVPLAPLRGEPRFRDIAARLELPGREGA